MASRTVTIATRVGIASFRRFGIDFSRSPKSVELTEEQIKAIEGESILEIVAAKAGKPAKKKAESPKLESKVADSAPVAIKSKAKSKK